MSEVRFDFTKDHLFSRESQMFNYRRIVSFLTTAFLWDFDKFKPLYNDNDLLEDKNTLFLTGTSKEIARKKEYLKIDTGIYCDRCGKKLERFPWTIGVKYMGLCMDCSRDMEKDYGDDMFGMKQKNRMNIEDPWWLN